MVDILWQATLGEEGAAQKAKLQIGSRIEVKSAAGPRLSGRTGQVIGSGYHPRSVRIVLDGSRSPITLHFTYVELAER